MLDRYEVFEPDRVRRGRYSRPAEADVHRVDVAWTLKQRAVATAANQRRI
jgi:hypothetical protein